MPETFTGKIGEHFTAEYLQEKGYEFEIDHPVDDDHTCIRLVTSWATPESAVETFLKDLADC